MMHAWRMLDKSLTYAWQSWHLHCVFRRHADGWSRTAKTVRRFFLTMMLLSLVSEEVYFPCVLSVELPLIECTKPCFEWRYQEDQRLWVFMQTCSTIFHFVTGMPAGTLSQRPSGVDEGSYQSSLRADVCGRTRAMKTTWHSHEN